MVSLKARTTKTVRTRKKVLTKKEKLMKRASKFKKLVEYRQKLKRVKKGKLVSLKKKKQNEADQQIIDFTAQQAEHGATEAEINIFNTLGLGKMCENPGDIQNDTENWQQVLEAKLKQANHKSLQNPEVRRVYGQIGRIFATYRSGKIPKAFKVIPNLQKWKQILMITRPDNWTPQAMYQAVTIFASNFDAVRAQEFYQQFLTPAIRADLQKNKKLNYHYYESLKKALYKTNAWFKGIMFQFCSNNTLSREISVLESLLSKMKIPVITSAVAIIKLTELEPNTAVYHYLRTLIDKSYNFPKKVIITLTQYLLKFKRMQEELPVIWHQLFLAFVRQYNNSIDEMEKVSLIELAKQCSHPLITPEILKELS